MENTIRKVYVDANGLVLFVCQNCGEVRKEQAQAYKETKGSVKIKCTCGNVYDVDIEKRKFQRKEIKLAGLYSNAANPRKYVEMIVKNISMQGCGFETLAPHMLHLNEEIKIEFNLNDANKSLIRRKALVRTTNKYFVGCKFEELPGALDPDFGFYLMKLKNQ